MGSSSFKMTDEQLKIINAISRGNNVKISAIAGSGKTTTSILIAETFLNKKCLLLTYNKFLSIDNNKRIESLGISNLECRTFHSFFSRVYEIDCSTNKGLELIISKNLEPKNFFDFDILIFDEIQDMTTEIYKCLAKTYLKKYMGKQIVILGDEFQTLYEFNGASPFFLSEYKKIWNFNNLKWEELKLSESFRSTSETASFVNDVLYYNHKIKPDFRSNKIGCKNNVVNLVINVFDPESIYNFLEPDLNKYKNEDIFIIAPSVDSSTLSPLTKFVNYLSDKKWLLFKATKDFDDISKKDMENKIIVTTFHKAKGLEKKLVIIFGFDDSLNVYYNIGNESKWNEPDNRVYVGVTRAQEKTILLTHYDSAPLRSINWDNNSKMGFVNFSDEITKSKFSSSKKLEKIKKQKQNFYVTNLLDYIKIGHNDIVKAYTYTTKKIDNPHKFSSKNSIEFFDDKSGKNYFEQVGWLLGTIFPMMFTHSVNKNTILESKNRMIDFYSGMQSLASFSNIRKKTENKEISIFFNNLAKLDFSDSSDFVKYSIGSSILYDGNETIFNQLKDYDFIKNEDVLASNDIFSNLYSNDLIIEKHVSAKVKNVNIYGAVDVIDPVNKIIWENKFVGNVNDAHFFQLLFYKYLLDLEDEKKYKDYKLKLFNLKTGIIYDIELIPGFDKVLLDLIVRKKRLGFDFCSNEENKKKLIDLANSVILEHKQK